MIETSDVIQLLLALRRSGGSEIGAVVKMLQAAQQGAPVDIDMRGLSVPPDVLSRLLEAAGQGGMSKNALMGAGA